MMPANCILLGKIIKVHGFEGAVTVKTELNLSENIPPGEPVFLEIDGRPVPFFIEESFSNRPGILNLKFEDYNSSDKVKEFVGCSIFVASSGERNSNEDDPENLAGFLVYSEQGDQIGTVSEIIVNPGQILLEVINENGGKILIPLHEDLVIDLNNEREIITMIIPDGLTDIN